MRKSHLTRLHFILPSVALATALFAGTAAAVELMPVSEVKAGMQGYGLTVFSGTKIERFRVKVISVFKNALPKMDLILIRCSGANLEHSGVVAGMSGSPIFLEVDGKERLIGALAYGWSFSKDPVAGVTPIHAMLEEAKRPLRKPLSTAATAGLSPGPESMDRPQLRPAATPLFLSGLSAPVLQQIAPELEKFNFLPLQGGGASAELVHEKVELEPGAAIGVQFMRGDMDITSVGTVTYREGDVVLAFGHPMFGIGELQFPITTAYVHHIFAGLARSFKMAGPLSLAGTLVQDRRPAVIGKIGTPVRMIPLRIIVNNPAANRRDVYNMEMVHHRQFTPVLTQIAMLNSVQISASDDANVSFEAKLSLKLPGRASIHLQDHLFSPTGVIGFGLFTSPVFRALQQVYSNPFEEVRAEAVEYTIDLLFKRDLAQIDSVRFAEDALTPGAKAHAVVRLQPYLGVPYEKVVEFDVPRSLQGQEATIFFAGGPNAPVETAPPESFDDLVKVLGRKHPSKSVVVTLQVPSQNLKIAGQMLPRLPRTVIDALSPANAATRSIVSPTLQQTVVPASHVIVGSQQVRMRIKRENE
jgi:hypothetical protein